MSGFLQKIIRKKEKEVFDLKNQDPFFDLNRVCKSFKQNLLTSRSVIAEIKRYSPAKGSLAPISDPVSLASLYEQGGASAISVLTDEHFFKGSLNDLKDVSHSLQSNTCAILRKEFIIDPIQIDQALHCGADAILLIVSVLKSKTQRLLKYAESLGLDVLVEVHSNDELKLALDSQAKIIGINNRNLTNLTVDIQTSLSLIHEIPKGIITVSESGILDVQTAHTLYRAGFNSLLIGEALVSSKDPIRLLHEIRGVQDEN